MMIKLDTAVLILLCVLMLSLASLPFIAAFMEVHLGVRI